MKVLQVCYKLPYPPNDGGAYSLYNSALCLMRSGQVELHVLAMKQLKNGDDETVVPQTFATTTSFTWVEIDNSIRFSKAMVNLFHPSSYFAARFYSKKFESALIEKIETNKYDIVQLEHSYLAVYLDALKKHFRGKVVLRAQNIEHHLWESYLSQYKLLTPSRLYLRLMTNRLKKFEIQAFNSIDGLICLSQQDQDIASKLSHDIKSTVIPIGFDEEKRQSLNSSNGSAVIYHLGSMDWLPNVQGVEWFLKAVLPELSAIKQNFQVHLAGKNMSAKLKALKNRHVIVDGEVDDALHYQSDKAIMIVPLLSGGGIRVKIIEALALGKAIVSTSKGAEGLNCVHGENILIADNPRLFAQHLRDCIENTELREKLSKNARKHFEKHFRLSTVGEQTVSFYRELMGS